MADRDRDKERRRKSAAQLRRRITMLDSLRE
jgi:hypothetical protein